MRGKYAFGAVLCSLIVVLAAGCESGSDDSTQAEPPADVAGQWYDYGLDYGFVLYQDSTNLFGNFTVVRDDGIRTGTITGTIVSNSVVLRFIYTGSSNGSVKWGTVENNTMSGTYYTTNGQSGEWSAQRTDLAACILGSGEPDYSQRMMILFGQRACYV